MANMRRYRQLARKRAASNAVGSPDAIQTKPPGPAGWIADGTPRAVYDNLRLMSHAMTQSWPIDEDTRAEVVEELRRIAASEPRVSARIAACRALIAADSLNAQREHAAQDAGRPAVVNVFDRANVLLQQLAPPAQADSTQTVDTQALPPPTPHAAARNHENEGGALLVEREKIT